MKSTSWAHLTQQMKNMTVSLKTSHKSPQKPSPKNAAPLMPTLSSDQVKEKLKLSSTITCDFCKREIANDEKKSAHFSRCKRLQAVKRRQLGNSSNLISF